MDWPILLNSVKMHICQVSVDMMGPTLSVCLLVYLLLRVRYTCEYAIVELVDNGDTVQGG